MRILIVDDDRLARDALASILTELVPAAELQQAADGHSMITAVTQWHPELAIVDINMPRLDGLSAIEELTRVGLDTEFIVLTAHAEFDFAHRSIKLPISDYLLKPTDPTELVSAVARSLENRHKRCRELAAVFATETAALVHSRLRVAPRDPLPHAENGRSAAGTPPQAWYLGAAVFRERAFGASASSDFPGIICHGRLVETPRLCTAVRTDTGQGPESAFVLVRTIPGDQTVATDLDVECQAISSSDELTSALWVSAPHPEGVLDRLRDALLQPELRFRGRPGRATPLPADLAEPSQTTAFCQELSAVFTAARAADEVRYLTAVNRLAKQHAEWPRSLRLGDISGFAEGVLGQPVEWGHPAALYRSLARLGPQIARQSGTAASRIGRIQQYLAEHFAEPLTLVGVARKFDLTPTYLSALFHEKTGTTFLAYLTELRISHARRVLENDPEVRVQELAALCGYASARHFSQVFRRLTGSYPSKYAGQDEETSDG